MIFESGTWPSDIAQLLDDHHLVVLSDKPKVRERFCDSFSDYLLTILDTQVIAIDGRRVTSLDGFWRELLQYTPTGRARSGRSAGLDGIVGLLRGWPGRPKRLYLLWRDADATLEADVQLFSRLVNALCAVAVEHEHINPERLVLQRAVFIGSSKLGAYAEDDRGQFSRWLDEHEETASEGSCLFWEAQSCVERPPVLTYRIDG